VSALIDDLDLEAAGKDMHALMAELLPFCRSITGDGVRVTLRTLAETIPLEVQEVASGTPVLDWTVPKEWNIRGASIRDPAGDLIVDFRDSNLHVVSYSVPINKRMPLEELKPRLHSLPEHPDWIPYRTSYYEESWGFCVTDRLLHSLADGDYEVRIDSTLEDGFLSFGEAVIPGATDREVLISTHVCHPSMCNDNLSGVVISAYLARHLASVHTRYTYRFVFVPGTIGAITWLALNEGDLDRIDAGLVLACAGDPGPLTYKRSRRGNALIDRAADVVLPASFAGASLEDFSPYGYDERQYCSPGFDLPVGCLTRTQYERFPEYHTSADDLDFVQPDNLADTLGAVLRLFEVVEGNETFINLNPKGEPRLGARGLYRSVGGEPPPWDTMALLWVLNLSDGRHSLLDIAERAGMRFEAAVGAADALIAVGLLERKL
jgi:aminopeptidase-like protein